MKKAWVVCGLVVILLALMWPSRSLRLTTDSKMAMGAFVTIDICSDKSEKQVRKILDLTWGLMEQQASLFNKYSADSELSGINKSFPNFVTISPVMSDALQQWLKHYRVTQGVFDITIEPLTALWKKSQSENVLPDKVALESLRKFLGPSAIDLTRDGQISLMNQYVKIDMGGMAAGYIVDAMVKLLRNNKIDNFLINASGDIYASGKNCHGKIWSIGIQEAAVNDSIDSTVRLNNCAIATSGDYERYVTINGRHYSHIIDPRTGLPVENIAAATIIAPTTLAADILSTSVTVLGKDEGLKLIEELGEGYAAVLFYRAEDGKISRIETNRLKDFYIH